MIKAVVVRILFAAHGSIAFSRVMLSAANTLDDVSMPWWMPYSNLIGLVLLFFETFITLYKRGGEDYKYFCPSVFFYLISIIPSMVMLEYDQFYQLQQSDCQIYYSQINETEISQLSFLKKFDDSSDLSELEIRTRRDVISNSSELDAYSTTTKAALPTPSSTPPLIGDHRFKDDALDVLHDLNFNLKEGIANSKELIGDLVASNDFDEGVWILGLHQVLLFFLVLGRWMLPRGGISREQLSQLLLVFIGTGADILEFVSETIEEGDPSQCSAILHYMIWTVWAWSLMQFNFVLTASTARKQNVATTRDATRKHTKECCGSCCQGFFQNPDVWGMLMTLFIQDLPFAAARCYFIFNLGIRSQMMIFFTLKNLLVVMLQLYRLKVLWQTRLEYFTGRH
ncbi:unnamed protein product [Oikopleura dioica]|uniref:Transmembrane protein 26 n=1 Tax=Oikopleura dioica TaxID=34765 RepID=E4YUS8_OIKDI|nr:unnamed protein product [Oikopleura dioica]